MKALFPSFFLMLATAADRELARQVHYLKTENRILRSKLPKRISVTAAERQRLLRYGKPLGAAIRALISIVSPRTFARWLNGETKQKSVIMIPPYSFGFAANGFTSCLFSLPRAVRG
ncbi:MAG: hypothetical protein ACRELF_25865 [Gemmataceae bacterium]